MFNNEQVMKLAELAGLNISNCDNDELRAALNSHLIYVGQIREVDVTGVEPIHEVEEAL